MIKGMVRCSPLLLGIALLISTTAARTSPVKQDSVDSGYIDVEGGRIFYEAAGRGSAVVGRPDFDTPVNIKEKAKQALDEGMVHYTSNYALPDLRRAISQKLDRDNGLHYDPAREIIVTVGANEAVFLATMALLNPGEEVLIPLPGT